MSASTTATPPMIDHLRHASQSADLLLNLYTRPGLASELDIATWNEVIRVALCSRMLPRLATALSEAGVLVDLAEEPRERLEAAMAHAAHHERGVRWETNRIERALRGISCPVVLLKGAAYVLAGLPAGRGRFVSDVDILVPREFIERVEDAFLAHGWEWTKVDEYDVHYYRVWSHESPPLKHSEREYVLDVHHAILPPTGRLHPDPGLLLEAARPLDGSRFQVFAPEDMVLHSAAHLFQDGDLAGGLRDLSDLDLLLRHFGECEPGFWERLAPRAGALELGRPLYYALRYTSSIMRTPIPGHVNEAAADFAPDRFVGWLMDELTERTLLSRAVDGRRWDAELAGWMLFVRYHWMRLPTTLLARHLTKKALAQWKERSAHEPVARSSR